MRAVFKGDGSTFTSRLAWLGWLPWLTVGTFGCAGFWDEVTSRDFQFKHLYSKPDPMVVLRDSSDGDQRAKALRSLREPLRNGGTAKDQDTYVQILTTAATADKEPLCRTAAITALGQFKDKRAVDALIQADQRAERDFSRELSTVIRQHALAALGDTGDPEARKWLVLVARAGAKEESDVEKQQTLDVRLTAIRALGKYSQYDATETLLHLLKTEKDVAVRDRAHQSLQVATGKSLPPDAMAWDNLLHPSGQGANGPVADDSSKIRNVGGWR